MDRDAEQRFDFDAVTTEAPAPPSRRRAPATRTSIDPAHPESDRDAATSLKQRIERLRERAEALEPAAPAAPRPPASADFVARPDDAVEDTALSIAEFYARVKRALSGEFSDELWVTGEIRSIRVSNGHRFIELADQGAEGRATQQLEVACWASQWRSVEASLAAAGLELEVGRVIRVLGRVSVWEAASRLRFTLSRIDVEALLGAIAQARQRLLAMLATEGLLERNRALSVPLVPLRIGLVTSEGSEAHKDFVGRLARSGFAFDVRLRHSLVQGADAPAQVAAALVAVAADRPDLCVIVRGGGSRGDLAAFDTEEVARAIATCACPVWVGVGHTGDHSVADEVANAAFITPTACGEAVAKRVAGYWDSVLDRVQHISGVARSRIGGAHDGLALRRARLDQATRAAVRRELSATAEQRTRLVSAARHHVQLHASEARQRRAQLARAVDSGTNHLGLQIRRRGDLLRAFDPERQLARGWAIVRDAEGRIVMSVDAVREGERVVVRVSDGDIDADVAARRSRERRST